MKKLFKLTTILFMSFVFAFSMSACSSEKSEAKKAFEEASSALTEQQTKLDDTIDSLQEIVDKGDPVLDESVTEAATSAIKDAQAAKYEIPEMASDVDEIKKQTEEMKAVSYDEQIDNLTTAKKNLEESIEKYKLVDNPTEDYVLSKIAGAEYVAGVEAATEDNDPNGNLHKQGGYTSAIFIQSDQVDQSTIDGDSIIDRGTDGGGCIEVYSTVEDAQKRDTYLASFDGTILSSGSHKVVGTCVVRTSSYLTATQQNDFTTILVDALTKLDE